MFFYELYIFSAVFRKILIFFDSTDIAFPSRKLLNNRFCFLKLHSCREFCCYLSVDLIACANRDLIQISQNIQYCKSNVCSSLETASVFGCNTVEPSIRLGRPVVAPNSPPSPPRFLSSSASSPKISETNAPAPTALE